MNRTTIEDAVFPGCPIRNILSRFGDKWSLLVIYTLDRQNRAVRFKELQREISDISQKMLTVTLRTLEEDGFVTRTIYPEVPPHCGICLDGKGEIITSAHQCLDWLGFGEYGRDSER